MGVWGQTDYTNRIANPSFEEGSMTGWTQYGYNPEGNEGVVSVTPNAVNDWRAVINNEEGQNVKEGDWLCDYWAGRWTGWWSHYTLYQKLTDLPRGHYELSATLATHEDKTVSLFAGPSDDANMNSIDCASYANRTSAQGKGTYTGLPLTVSFDLSSTSTVTIGAGLLNHPSVPEIFLKADAFHLTYYGETLATGALPLPNDLETLLADNQWYYYDVRTAGSYSLVGNVANMVYTIDGTKTDATASLTNAQTTLSFGIGRVYFKKKTTDAATLRISSIINEGTTKSFSVCALNVDGLPQTVAGIDLNPDGPGSDGTKLISQYLASKGYDFIGVSEDFNYHGSLMSSLNNYSSGTVRSTLSLWELSIPFDTDGLNFIWKNDWTTFSEKWTRWNESTATDGNQYVKKGFRYYELDLGDGMVTDVYVLHMDAGDAVSTRESQWSQLATDILNAANTTRPKLIIGDTNSRWTREEINTQFFAPITATNQYTISDVWVEKAKGGTYPTTAQADLTDQSDPTNYANYEVVDKIIYINPTAANTTQLTAQSFRIEQDYTYGTVQGTSDATPLGDHKPLVATFTITKPVNTLSETKHRWAWQGEELTTGDRAEYQGSVNKYWLFNPFVGCRDNERRGFLTPSGKLVANPADATRYSFYGTTTSATCSNSAGDRLQIYWDWFDYKAVANASEQATTWSITSHTQYTEAYEYLHNQWSNPYDVYPILQKDHNGTTLTTSDTRLYSLYGGKTLGSRYFGVNNVDELEAQSTSDEQAWWALISVEQYEKYLEYCSQWDKLKEYYTYLPLSSEMRVEIEALLAKCAHWQSGTTEEIIAMNEEIESWFDDPHTDKIFNPSFELDASGNPLPDPGVAIEKTGSNLNGWTVNPGAGGDDGNNGTHVMYKNDWRKFEPIDGNYMMETWNGTMPTGGFYLEQEIDELPEGFYRLTARLASDQGNVIYMTLGNKTTPHTCLTGNGTSSIMDVPLYYHNGKGKVKIRVYSKTYFKADDFRLNRYDYYYDETITCGPKYATTAIRYNTQLPVGFTTYYATRFAAASASAPTDRSLHLEKYTGKYLKAEEGVILHDANLTTANRICRFFRTRSTKADDIPGNILYGTSTEIPAENLDPDYCYYMLARKTIDGEKIVGFFRLNADPTTNQTLVKIKAHKAYLKVDKDTKIAVKEMLTFSFDDEEEEVVDQVKEIEASGEYSGKRVIAIYNLNGMRQSQMQRGINLLRMDDGSVRKVLVP